MYTVARPNRLLCTQYLGPPFSYVHSTSAHSSLLEPMSRPSRLQCTQYLGPPHLCCNQYLGPVVSIVAHSWAHPSPLYMVHRPSHINGHITSAHPSTSIPLFTTDRIYPYTTFYAISLRPTPFYRVHLHSAHPYLTLQLYRPTRLYCISGLGPSLSILPYSWAHPSLSYTLSTIHYYCYIEYTSILHTPGPSLSIGYTPYTWPTPI